MQIDRLSSLFTLRLPDKAALPTLRVGDEMMAKVIKADAGRIRLDLGGSQLEARTSLSLQPGQQLLLRVTQLQPTVVLRLAAEVSAEEAVDDALRTLLPQTSARAPLNAPLARLASQALPPLPEPVQRALSALLARLPQPDALARPDSLARALAHSGLFMESHLAHAAPSQGRSTSRPRCCNCCTCFGYHKRPSRSVIR